MEEDGDDDDDGLGVVPVARVEMAGGGPVEVEVAVVTGVGVGATDVDVGAPPPPPVEVNTTVPSRLVDRIIPEPASAFSDITLFVIEKMKIIFEHVFFETLNQQSISSANIRNDRTWVHCNK